MLSISCCLCVYVCVSVCPCVCVCMHVYLCVCACIYLFVHLSVPSSVSQHVDIVLFLMTISLLGFNKTDFYLLQLCLCLSTLRDIRCLDNHLLFKYLLGLHPPSPLSLIFFLFDLHLVNNVSCVCNFYVLL